VVTKIFGLRGRRIEDRENAYCDVSGFLFHNRYYGNQEVDAACGTQRERGKLHKGFVGIGLIWLRTRTSDTVL